MLWAPLLAVALPAADAPMPVSPKAKPVVEKKEEAAKPEETIFFTVKADKRMALGRTDSNTRCKAYLGRNGEGWVPFPDPKIDGSDYMAISSPDSAHLALLSARGGAINLWLLSPDGRTFERLTDDDAGIVEAKAIGHQMMAFSPDSKHLAFIMRGEAWIMGLKARQPRVLTKGGNVSALAFSPDGKWVALVQGQSVRRIAASGEPNQLLASDACDQPSLAWNPDAKSEELYFFGRGVQRVNTKRQVELVAPSTSKPNQVALLPSNTLALLVPSNSGQAEVFLVALNAKGSVFTQVTQGGADGVWASAGGKHIFFLRDQVLWRCDLAGLKAKPLGSVPMGHVTLGALPPLKGVCP
jgi:WD40 repeat protein